jgi:hypothetical protein
MLSSRLIHQLNGHCSSAKQFNRDTLSGLRDESPHVVGPEHDLR